MKPSPILTDFPQEEYTEFRWKKAKEAMHENDLDALMLTDNMNFYWFTGYNPGSHKMRANILILSRTGDPAAFIYMSNRNVMLSSSWVINIEGYVDCPFIIEEFGDFLKKLGLSGARIGCELGQDQRLAMPFMDFIKLKNVLLPKAEFIDAGKLIWGLMMMKTPAEVERVRRACLISDEAFTAWRERLKIGMTQKEVRSMLQELFIEKGATDRNFPGNISVDNTGRGSTMDRPFKRGDILWVDFGAQYRGYKADYARRLSFGEPSELQKKHHELIWRVIMKEIDAIEPDVKCSEVFEIMNSEMKRLGLSPMDPRKRAGHGLGLENMPPSINAFDDTLLKPNMVLTPEPRFETDYGRVHVEETVVVTKNGCEVLTRAPRELYVIK